MTVKTPFPFSLLPTLTGPTSVSHTNRQLLLTFIDRTAVSPLTTKHRADDGEVTRTR